MPKKKSNRKDLPVPMQSDAQKRVASSFKPTEQLATEARIAMSRSRFALDRMTGANKKQKRTKAEQKQHAAYHRELAAKRKAAPALKDPIDKVLVKYWGKNKKRFRNRNEFYLMASEELEISQVWVRARTSVLMDAGLIVIKTTTKAVSKPHLADNLKVYLSAAERKIVRKSRFASMPHVDFIRELKIIKQEKPANIKQVFKEAILVYRARTGKSATQLAMEVNG
jgi:hypothetical protein